ncbi:M6 family metalloprotease domain-containing protein [Krasilnikovia sp. MM14-A1004]|uniref:M6 family metalloprotease domain-containing protein n=1 Tax=Krasilnikovia sp. MM14-A1004 TaxID=3373541 RepID=UPI00399D226A
MRRRWDLRSALRAVVGVTATVAAGLTVAPAPPAAAATRVPVAGAAAPAADCRLPASGGIGNEQEGPTDYRRWLPAQGALRAVFLFVDFSDAPGGAGELAERRDMFASAPGDWLRTASYGRASLVPTFTTAWARMPRPQSAYAGFNASFEAHRAYLQDAVTASDAVVDFTGFDLVYVVSPRSATAIAVSPAFIADPGWGVSADGVELRHGVTLGADVDSWGYRVLNHETGHVFGLPDLYTYGAGWPDLHRPVGGWDLMGLISGPAPDHLAWHKWKLGWLDDTQISCVTAPGTRTVTLTPLGTATGLKAAVVKVSAQRVIVVENRRADSLDVASPCLRPGVLVYAVEAGVGGGNNPVRVIDAQPGSAVDGCGPGDAELDNATLTAVGQQVTDAASGVRVTLTGTSGAKRTVQVAW